MGQVMDGARGEDEDEKKLALLDDDEEDPFATRPATQCSLSLRMVRLSMARLSMPWPVVEAMHGPRAIYTCHFVALVAKPEDEAVAEVAGSTEQGARRGVCLDGPSELLAHRGKAGEGRPKRK